MCFVDFSCLSFYLGNLQKSLPRLEEQIEEKLAQTRAELERYGNGPPSDAAERVVFFIDVSTLNLHIISLATKTKAHQKYEVVFEYF